MLSGGGGNSSGQNKAFDQAIFLFAFYIMASYKYVNSRVNSLVSQGTYAPLWEPIVWDDIMRWWLVYCEKIRACKHLAGGHDNKKKALGGKNASPCEDLGGRKGNYLIIYCWSWKMSFFAGHFISPQSLVLIANRLRVFIYHQSVYLCAQTAPGPCDLITLPCCRRSHSRLGFPVTVPLVRSGLPTSGSDEPNWKHVLHAGSPDRWDNIILLMTERERRRAGERGRSRGRKILPPQRACWS